MTKQYFEEDMSILVNCTDLGFHQVSLLILSQLVESLFLIIKIRKIIFSIDAIRI